jgi:glycosyltransferase involved in cell wall biosynthesis
VCAEPVKPGFVALSVSVTPERQVHPSMSASPLPTVSVVIPLYQTERYIAETLQSVLAQTFKDFEVIVVDDGSTDRGPGIARAVTDPRVRVITQINRGLAGARNTGIRNARGRYIALLDADDLWEADKLARHVAAMEADPAIGISFSSSRLIDEDGRDIGMIQSPATMNFDLGTILCRNPVGNGSAPVLRRETFDAIAYDDAAAARTFWFDESFRQSEDVECWTRIAVTTKWTFHYIDAPLTKYRVNSTGLSANVGPQLATWRRFRAKVATYAPDLDQAHGDRAEAYELRYLARRAVRSGDAKTASDMMLQALKLAPRIVLEEPVRSLSTITAIALRRAMSPSVFDATERFATLMARNIPGLRI